MRRIDALREALERAENFKASLEAQVRELRSQVDADSMTADEWNEVSARLDTLGQSLPVPTAPPGPDEPPVPTVVP